MRRPESRSHRARAAVVVGVVAVACSCDLTVSLGGLEGGCPRTQGPSQVMITSGSSPFCIDTTEVTNAEYTQFVGSGFTLSGSGIPDGCGTLTGTTPGGTWPYPSGEDDFPVTNVNWCQAYAYCQWAGKRLCGQIGGGSLANSYDTNATYSQWLNACSGGGALTYPYGDTFEQGTCGGQAAGSMIAIVGSSPACVGSVAGLFDMSGNVWEWTDACGTGGATAFCDAMGGAFDSVQAELECVGERNWTRNAGANDIGLRCCLDL
ncbi:MAG: SUMF1/EgtB/PvdO family nonheme iron enzyme [Polyangiaceae bacterium]|jgi:sulfatase modifying factor 1